MGTQLVKTGRVVYNSITVLLGSNLHNIRWGEARTRYIEESDDKTLREVITVGDRIPEITADIRYHDDPDELQAAISAGLDGAVWTYSPDGGSTEYDCLVIDASDVEPDDRRVGFGEYKATVTLRATNSTTDFSPLAALP